MSTNKLYPLGIDVGATSTKIGLFNQQWDIIARRVISADTYQVPEEFFKEIKKAVEDIFEEFSLEKKNAHGIGIGLPGCVDSRNGIVRDLTNLPEWHSVKVAENMKQTLGIPTYIDNDVNLMTIGELEHGAGKMCNNMICCTLGTGVGGGIVINGKLYRGSTLCAGEIGHMFLFPGLTASSDNKDAILEKYVGNNAIISRTQKMIENARTRHSILLDLVENNVSKITPKIIYEAAVKGCHLSKTVWEETGYYIGMVFASIVNLLNPDKIVIGGGIAQAGDILFEPIATAIRKNAIAVATCDIEIVPAELKEDAGMYGAATYGMKYEYYGEK